MVLIGLARGSAIFGDEGLLSTEEQAG